MAYFDGTANDDMMTFGGTIGTDTFYGYAGNDRIETGPDSALDVVYGGFLDINLTGTGNDTLTGGLGYEYLFGLDGDDTLSTGTGGGAAHGGDGNDTLTGGAGAGTDLLYGGNGDDLITNLSGISTIAGGGGQRHHLRWRGHRAPLWRRGRRYHHRLRPGLRRDRPRYDDRQHGSGRALRRRRQR